MDRLRTAQLPPHAKRRKHGATRATREQQVEPRLPHERDESSDSQQQHHPDERIDQAARDVEQGRVDTGREPVVDELARKHFPPERGREGRRR